MASPGRRTAGPSPGDKSYCLQRENSPPLYSGGNDNILNLWSAVAGGCHGEASPLHCITQHQAAVKVARDTIPTVGGIRNTIATVRGTQLLQLEEYNFLVLRVSFLVAGLGLVPLADQHPGQRRWNCRQVTLSR